MTDKKEAVEKAPEKGKGYTVTPVAQAQGYYHKIDGETIRIKPGDTTVEVKSKEAVRELIIAGVIKAEKDK